MYLCSAKLKNMEFEYHDEEIEALINHKYVGRYKSYKSRLNLNL